MLISCVAPINVKQTGGALLLALFLIIVMSLLAGALMKMIDSSNESVAVEVFGQRTYLAASTGLEMMSSAVFPLDAAATASTPASPKICADAATDIGNFAICSYVGETATCNLPNTLGMNGCAISMTCQQRNISEADSADGDAVTFYRFISIATCDFGTLQTSRQLQIEAKWRD